MADAEDLKSSGDFFLMWVRLPPRAPFFVFDVFSKTLYSLGKAASLDGDAATAEQAWSKVIELEKKTSLAAQAHFGLAGLYRKQDRAVTT